MTFTSLRKLVHFVTKSSTRGSKSFSIISNIMSEPLVTVQQGKLKGALKQMLDGNTYYSFKGIPYAEVAARFRAPQTPSPWEGTYEATNHGPVCTQYDMTLRQIVQGDENCLFLNVYTRSLEPSAKLPVMVFIHGGAYMSGSGNTDAGLGPEFLLQHNVILVTVNYRLEVLGFLCLDTPEVPGNAGMKDQVAALRWVNNNIAQFGGDPNNVTLFGESAGSASVTFHMQSPMSTGLFHKAIAQSGVSIADWAQGVDGKERAFRTAKHLGNDSKDTTQVFEFLKGVSATELSKLTFKTMTKDEKARLLRIHFAPVVEKRFEGVEPFITEEALDSLLAGKIKKVPLMIGYNSNEALLMVDSTLSKLEFANRNPRYFVPREIAKRVSEEKEIELGERIKSFYFGNRDFTSDDIAGISNLLSDIHFVYNAHRFAHFYSPLANTYFYKFSCDTELNIIKSITNFSDMPGASHADELFYIFYSVINKDAYNENPRLRDMVYRITKMWTDFAKASDPTPDNSLGVKWTPYSQSNRAYLDINEQLTIGSDTEKERVEFWNKIYLEVGRPCIIKSNL